MKIASLLLIVPIVALILTAQHVSREILQKMFVERAINVPDYLYWNDTIFNLTSIIVAILICVIFYYQRR